MAGQHLAQAALGLPGGHNDQRAGEIERALADPIAREPGHDGVNQRLIPGENVKAW